MKRIMILLAVLVALAWVGSMLSPTHEPAPESAQTPAGMTPTQTKPAPSEPEKSLSPAEKKTQQEKWFGAETIVAAQRAVRGALKDPDSAQFKDVYANYTEKFGVVACGKVNSKNSFGAYTGFRRFVSSGRSVILEEQDNIADAWVEACL